MKPFVCVGQTGIITLWSLVAIHINTPSWFPRTTYYTFKVWCSESQSGALPIKDLLKVRGFTVLGDL